MSSCKTNMYRNAQSDIGDEKNFSRWLFGLMAGRECFTQNWSRWQGLGVTLGARWVKGWILVTKQTRQNASVLALSNQDIFNIFHRFYRNRKYVLLFLCPLFYLLLTFNGGKWKICFPTKKLKYFEIFPNQQNPS